MLYLYKYFQTTIVFVGTNVDNANNLNNLILNYRKSYEIEK